MSSKSGIGPAKSLLAAALIATAQLVSTQALAYCRATPCDPASGKCNADAHLCSTVGPVLFWLGGHVILSVDGAGSKLRDISGDDARKAVAQALSAWTGAKCEDGHRPDLHTRVDEVAAGVMAGFDASVANENDVLFRDAVWPYENSAVAKTTLGFDPDSGELEDADIQLDSALFDLSVAPTSVTQVDAVAVLTHEIGHVLGLGHSDVPGATMQPETSGFGTAALRTLEPDDVAGICAIYPPGASATTAAPSATDGTDGSSKGCAVSLGGSPSPGAMGLALVALFASRRRRRTRTGQSRGRKS